MSKSKKHTVTVIWGESDSRRAAEGEWNELENGPCDYSFNTLAEENAFLEGVDAASGWLEHYILGTQEIKAYQKSLKE